MNSEIEKILRSRSQAYQILGLHIWYLTAVGYAHCRVGQSCLSYLRCLENSFRLVELDMPPGVRASPVYPSLIHQAEDLQQRAAVKVFKTLEVVLNVFSVKKNEKHQKYSICTSRYAALQDFLKLLGFGSIPGGLVL